MDPDYVVGFAESTIKYLENDKKSFESVLDNGALEGKLGFAMIATAMAAFDLFAWILYQTFNLKKRNNELFTKLMNDPRFFNKTNYIDEKMLYNVIRCGVLHQLYPKDADIQARKDNEIIRKAAGDRVVVNSFALYCDVLEGCKKILDHFKTCSDEQRADYSLMLAIRQRMDNNFAT
mgnify:CR=1 FL=1